MEHEQDVVKVRIAGMNWSEAHEMVKSSREWLLSISKSDRSVLGSTDSKVQFTRRNKKVRGEGFEAALIINKI